MTSTLTAPRPDLAPSPASPPTEPSHSRLPSRGTVVGLLLLSLVLVVAGVVTVRGLFTAPIRFDDEGTYVSQAIAVLHGHLAPYTYWYDHPPAGWIIISGWMGTFGRLWRAPNPIATGREFMYVLNLVSVALVYVAGRRLSLSRPAAAASGLLFALSPLALSFHRMVLLDNVATPLLLASVVLALSPRRRLGATLGCGLAFGIAVLSKETVLLIAPFVLWLLWCNAERMTRKMNVAVFCLAFTVPVVLYALFALTRGELMPGTGHVSLLSGVDFQLAGRTGSGSILDPHSDAHRTVRNWLALDPYLVTAGVLLAVPALLLRRIRPVAAALLFLAVMLLRPGYLPIPYVVVILPLAALVVAGVVDAAIRHSVTLVIAGRKSPRPRSAPVRVAGTAAALAVTAGAVAACVPAEPRWRAADTTLQRADLDAPYQQTSAWLRTRVPPTNTLLVDNVVWTDLRAHGYQQRHLVWFTKVGVDPSLAGVAPSWRSFDYVVSTDIMRTAPTSTAITRDALLHSQVVASFGSGSNRIDIRKVVK